MEETGGSFHLCMTAHVCGGLYYSLSVSHDLWVVIMDVQVRVRVYGQKDDLDGVTIPTPYLQQILQFSR